MKNHRLFSALALFTALLSAPLIGHAEPLDPRSLVGEWVGTWSGRHASGSGPYRLVIERVDGDKLHGRVETVGGPGQQRAPVEFRVNGVVEGNHVRYGPTSNHVDVDVDGSTMRGTWTGAMHRDLSLTKQ